jgi:hypothetical protein
VVALENNNIILRKIFGPTKELNGPWRIKTNEELDELIKLKNIIRFIKSQRLKSNGQAMWKGCQNKEKLQEFIYGSHLPLDQ